MYKLFLKNLGLARNSTSIGISYDQYITSHFFIPIDLSPELCFFQHQHADRKGEISIELSFSRALTHAVTLITELTYNSQVTFNTFNQATVSME